VVKQTRKFGKERWRGTRGSNEARYGLGKGYLVRGKIEKRQGRAKQETRKITRRAGVAGSNLKKEVHGK